VGTYRVEIDTAARADMDELSEFLASILSLEDWREHGATKKPCSMR
jgi:hypothetical protein